MLVHVTQYPSWSKTGILANLWVCPNPRKQEPWCREGFLSRFPQEPPGSSPAPPNPGHFLPDVPGLLEPLAILTGTAQPVERRRPAAGPGGVAPKGPGGPVGLAGRLLQQLG